jgi:hypothetical protein
MLATSGLLASAGRPAIGREPLAGVQRAFRAHTETAGAGERCLWESECRARPWGWALLLYATLVAVVAAGSCTDRKRVAIAEVVARRWPSPGRRLALRLFPVAI